MVMSRRQRYAGDDGEEERSGMKAEDDGTGRYQLHTSSFRVRPFYDVEDLDGRQQKNRSGPGIRRSGEPSSRLGGEIDLTTPQVAAPCSRRSRAKSPADLLNLAGSVNGQQRIAVIVEVNRAEIEITAAKLPHSLQPASKPPEIARLDAIFVSRPVRKAMTSEDWHRA